MVPTLERLVEALSLLPTIGRKSAWRLALHLLDRPTEEVDHLADTLRALKRNVVTCTRCYNFSEARLCEICTSSTRDGSVICIVEKSADIISIEKTGRFKGLYHVLGGLLSPLHGMTADKLRLAELQQRVATEHPAELIIGLGASSDAEVTGLYVARLFAGSGLRITRFARGLPAGMELEYVDQLTLHQALNDRTNIS